MALEAIKAIHESEETAKAAKAEGAARARKMLADAETDGKAAVETAREKARQELAVLRVQAADKAREDAEALVRKTENRKAGMAVHADRKTAEAVKYVVERIVNG